MTVSAETTLFPTLKRCLANDSLNLILIVPLKLPLILTLLGFLMGQRRCNVGQLFCTPDIARSGRYATQCN